MIQSWATIALGSNIGDRVGHLKSAILRISESLSDVACSDVFETVPVGGPAGQGLYLNMVVIGTTDLGPYDLLHRLQLVEKLGDRVRTTTNGPRTIDVDLIDIAGSVIDDPELTLPHPRAATRAFVLAPLLQLDRQLGYSLAPTLSAQLCDSKELWSGEFVFGIKRVGALETL